MKIKTLILLALVLLSYGRAINAQEQDTIAQKPKMRTVFLTFLGVGYPEFINLRLGWQINDEWSVAAKASIYDGDSMFGVALFDAQITRYFPNSKIIFNNISAGGGYLPNQGDEFLSLEVYTGWEGTYRWVRPYWAVGFSYVSEKYHLEKYHYFYPVLKWDLISTYNGL